MYWSIKIISRIENVWKSNKIIASIIWRFIKFRGVRFKIKLIAKSSINFWESCQTFEALFG
jgi:hypothetical protein